MTRLETATLRWLGLGLGITGGIFIILGLAHHSRTTIRLLPDVETSFDLGYLIAGIGFLAGALVCLLGSIAIYLDRLLRGERPSETR